jgi:hypothetical protein
MVNIPTATKEEEDDRYNLHLECSFQTLVSERLCLLLMMPQIGQNAPRRIDSQEEEGAAVLPYIMDHTPPQTFIPAFSYSHVPASLPVKTKT